MSTSLWYAVAVSALGLVCWPSAAWQRILLGVMATLARLGVLGMLAGLGAQAVYPGSVPGSMSSLVKAAAETNQLDPTSACLLLAVIVACAAVPVLAALDFARSLADNRAVSRALRAALYVLQQHDPSLPPAPISPAHPDSIPAALVKSASARRRRVGDLTRG